MENVHSDFITWSSLLNVQFDGEGRLWVCGRSVSVGSGPLKLGVAVLDADGEVVISLIEVLKSQGQTTLASP